MQRFDDENTPPTERVTDDERRAVITRWQEQRGFAPSDEATLPDVAEGLDISVADAARLLAEIRAERAAAHQAELDARRAALEDAETAARLAEAQARQAEAQARIHQAAEAALIPEQPSRRSEETKWTLILLALVLFSVWLMFALFGGQLKETSHVRDRTCTRDGKPVDCRQLGIP